MKSSKLKPRTSHHSTPDVQPFFKKDEGDAFLPVPETSPFFNVTRNHGNKTTNNLQTKLKIGHPNDKYEVEADTMADKVVQNLNTQSSASTHQNNKNLVQRNTPENEHDEKLQKKEQEESGEDNLQLKPIFESDGEEGNSNNLQRKPLASQISSINGFTINRKEDDAENEDTVQQKEDETDNDQEPTSGDTGSEESSLIQAKSDHSQNGNSSDLRDRLNSSRGNGQPLSPDIQTSMGQSFGADFSQVRIHNDGNAVQMNQELGAQAFTHGNDIYFNEGKYDPESTYGKHLLAHELTHTIQQGSAKVRRNTGPGNSSNFTSSAKNIIHTKKQHPNQEKHEEIIILWKGSFRSSYMQHLQSLGVNTKESIRLADELINRHNGWTSGNNIFKTDAEAAEFIESLPEPSFRLVHHLKTFLKKSLNLSSQQLEQASKTVTTLNIAKNRAMEISGNPPRNYRSNYRLLKNPKVAKLYLEILEHYLHKKISEKEKNAVRNGLNDIEIASIIEGDNTTRLLTDLFTQSLSEFKKSRGSNLEHFRKLIMRLVEQLLWGNPNAVSNNLGIGYGAPKWLELGIIFRPNRILYYDKDGNPLPGFSGIAYRDKGYIAVEPFIPKDYQIQIEDPGLQFLISILKQEFSDPMLAIGVAAKVYFENIELVNKKVQKDLPQEIINQFGEMLPFFIGFLAGHALSVLLLKMSNPFSIAIGLSLQVALRGAGYLLGIQAAAGALTRLHYAAQNLSRVSQDSEGKLTTLSENYLNDAATYLRQIVIDVALTAGTLALGAMIRGASKLKLKLSCTRCRLVFRMINSNGTLTSSGIKHLRKKYPNRFANKSNSDIQNMFRNDSRGVLLEELILEEISQTHKRFKAISPISNSIFIMRKSINSIIKTIRKVSPDKLKSPKKVKTVLDMKPIDFVNQNSKLKAAMKALDNHPNQHVRALWNEWAWGQKSGDKSGIKAFKLNEGKVGNRKPDGVELFLKTKGGGADRGRDLMNIVDPTWSAVEGSVFGPIHQFKSLFYRSVMEAITKLEVTAQDIGPGNIVFID